MGDPWRFWGFRGGGRSPERANQKKKKSAKKISKIREIFTGNGVFSLKTTSEMVKNLKIGPENS